MNSLAGVKFVTIEKGQKLPAELAEKEAQWNTAIAMYYKNTVYVRGESFGDKHGSSNTPVLHELLHAATAKKINLARKYLKEGTNLNSPLVKAVLAMHQTMVDAREAFINGAHPDSASDKHLAILARDGKAFTNLDEFLAYGNSDPAMQELLLTTQGRDKNVSLFSKFVDSIRNMFGMGKDTFNGLSDLILSTDRIISAKDSTTEESEPGALSAILPTPQEKLDKAVAAATKAVKTSRIGNALGKATANLSSYREPRYLWGEIKGIWDSASANLRSRISHMYTSDALAYGGPGEVITGLRDTHEAIQKVAASKQAYLRGTAEMANKLVEFFRAKPELREKFEDIVNETTIARYDPSNPQNKVRDAKLDADYAALGADGQKLYKTLRDHYKAMNDVKQHLLEENLSKLGLKPDAYTSVLAGLRKLFEADKIAPYFPLARFGEYVLETGKKGGPKYRFDTMMQRDRAAREFAEKEGKSVEALSNADELRTSHDNSGAELRATVEKSSSILKAAYEAIDSANLGKAGAQQDMKDGLYQAYLAAMPENSIRKQFIHRKNTPGFSSDILRSVNETGLKISTAFAKLEHSADIRNSLGVSRRQLQGNEKYAPFVKRMEELANEAISPKENTDAERWLNEAANLVTKISFIRNLTSFSSALMQPLDIVLKGAPVLFGNHGAKAIPELLKMTNLMKQFGTQEKMPDGSVRWRAPSIEYAKGLTAEERKAVREMVDLYGVTKNTLTHEIFDKSRKASTSVDSKAMETAKSAVDNLILGGLMHHGERLARESMALTSFRLHLAEMNKANPSKKATNYHEAVKAAVRETNEALGNYDINNRPLVMRGPLGKLVSMYKFFPLITTRILAGNFFRMLPGLNKEGKAAAATKFFGILGTHALFGGVVALPAFSLAMKAMGAAWQQWLKDDDAPDEMRDKDFETWFRTEYLPSVFDSPDMKRIAEYGLLNYATGWNVSSRMSLNDMWYRDPQPGKTLKDEFLNWGQVIGGPVASTALNFAQGAQLMSEGDYERGLEKLTPGSISKMMMAYRYATQGVQTPQGVQMVEPGKMSTRELIGQSIGYAPAGVSAAQDISFRASAIAKRTGIERTDIMHKLQDAFRKSADPTMSDSQVARYEKMLDTLLEKRIEFNARNPEYAIKSDDLLKAIRATQKNIIQTEGGSGVKLDKKTSRLLGPSSDAAAEALARYQ